MKPSSQDRILDVAVGDKLEFLWDFYSELYQSCEAATDCCVWKEEEPIREGRLPPEGFHRIVAELFDLHLGFGRGAWMIHSGGRFHAVVDHRSLEIAVKTEDILSKPFKRAELAAVLARATQIS